MADNDDAPIPPLIMQEIRDRLMGAVREAGNVFSTGMAAPRALEMFKPSPTMRHLAGEAIEAAKYPGEMVQAGYEGRLPPPHEMVPWATGQALGMIGGASPFAVRGALGAGGGKVVIPSQPLEGGHEARIGQRIPTAVGYGHDPHAIVDLDALMATPELAEKNIGLVKNYPNMRPEDASGATPDVARNFINHLKDNLRFLYDRIPPDVRARSQLWYDGANAIVRGRAAQYGLPEQSVAGVYAAMSPQKDWFQNVGLGDRVLHIHHNARDAVFDDAMMAKVKELFPDADYSGLKGVKYWQINDPDLKPVWLRVYDQVHHLPDYHILTPEGEVSHVAMTQKGEPAKIAWGSLNEIGKAIKAIESGGNADILSAAMGERNKVRNFYNNMLDPYSPHGDVTIDTHAVAAALLRALSGNSLEVAHNFSNWPGKGLPSAGGSAHTGIQGTYPLYAQAYRELAAELGIHPRQLQSITWEGAKGLFSDTFKANKKNVAAIDTIWHNYRAGKITADEARAQIHDFAGGIDLPEWAVKP